jgi:hypothetical protein
VDDRVSIPDREKRSFSAPQYPNLLWGPPCLLSSGHGRLLPGGGVKGPGREDDHSPPSSADVMNVELYLHSPTRLYDMVLNQLSTGQTLPLRF